MREPDFVDECYADKDLSLLKKLTLVIPTYNRNYYLSRCLWYHAHFPFGEIIVADSSPEEKKVVNRETVQKVREMFGANIRYLEYEPETEKYGGDIYRKWGDAVQHVETEYSLITTDKQFHLPSVLAHGIKYLDIHQEYVSIDWIKCRIQINKDKTPQILIFRDHNFLTKSIIDEEPMKRYLHRCELGIDSSVFSLYRQNTHKYIYNHVQNLDLRFGEIFLDIAGYIYGKAIFDSTKVSLLRDLTLLHVNGNINRDESSTMRYPNLRDYYSSGVYNDFQKNFLETLKIVFYEHGYHLSQDELNTLFYKLNTPKSISAALSLDRILMKWRGCYLVWDYVPERLKALLKRGMGYSDKRWELNIVPDEIQIISEYILDTISNHQNDEPIL